MLQVRVEFSGCVSAKRVVAFATGGVILGMGMTVSGAVSLNYALTIASNTLVQCYGTSVSSLIILNEQLCVELCYFLMQYSNASVLQQS